MASRTANSTAPRGSNRPGARLSPVDLQEASTAPRPQPSTSGLRASDEGFLPLTTREYLELVEWTGRQVVFGKSQIPASLPSLLARFGIAADDWLPLAHNFGKLFHRVAGSSPSIARFTQSRARRYRPGQANLLGRT